MVIGFKCLIDTNFSYFFHSYKKFFIKNHSLIRYFYFFLFIILILTFFQDLAEYPNKIKTKNLILNTIFLENDCSEYKFEILHYIVQ